jgi:hypothetical protein
MSLTIRNIMLFFSRVGGGSKRQDPRVDTTIGPLLYKSSKINALQDAKIEMGDNAAPLARRGVDGIIGKGELGADVLYYDWRGDEYGFLRRYKIIRVRAECFQGVSGAGGGGVAEGEEE